MKVLIDADGCPVVNIAVELCRQYRIDCVLLCDTAHEMRWDGVRTLIFDKGTDSVDFALVNRVNAGDIVVTQDYGLASMCLARKARVLHQDGWEYTSDNIQALLFQRHASKEFRASGGRLKGPSKRKQSQNTAFQQTLELLLQQMFQG